MSLTILAGFIAGCSSDPCAEQPDSIFCTALDDTGETGTKPGPDGCVPELDGEAGYTHACHGTGNGWLVIDVVGDGLQPPACVNWGPDGKPDEPTTADCVPLDLTMLPNEIPSPGACCSQDADPMNVETQCAEDCGYAACSLAIAKIREAALALPHADSMGLKKTAEERVRDDLLGIANLLELPTYFEFCANEVKDAGGQPIEVPLGAGASSADVLGHVINATLTLQCTLDGSEAYVFEGEACEATPNIPVIEGESDVGGSAVAGAVTLLGPDGQAVGLSNIVFEFRELHMRGGASNIVLALFEADAADARHGALVFHDPHLRLVEPAFAPLTGEEVTFPTGALHLEVSSVIESDGVLLLDGTRAAAVHANSGPARAVRTLDGGFAFVDAPFEAGGYHFVLNTEAGSGSAR